jgi:hypothetical protein
MHLDVFGGHAGVMFILSAFCMCVFETYIGKPIGIGIIWVRGAALCGLMQSQAHAMPLVKQ